MEKIASKTKIKKWGCVAGDDESLQFDKFDFAPDQIAALDRWLQDKEAQVRITIAVEQKKLQIEDLVAVVKFKGVELTAGGQKVTLAGFKSDGGRAQTLKNLTQHETPVVVTFEEVAPRLFGGEKGPKGSAGEKGDDERGKGVKGAGGPHWHFVPKLVRGLRLRIDVDVQRRPDGFYIAQATCALPGAATGDAVGSTDGFASATDALADLVLAIDRHLTDKITDQRRLAVEQKLNAQTPAWAKEITAAEPQGAGQ